MKKIIIVIAVLISTVVICGFALPCFFKDELLSDKTTVISIGDNEGSYLITHNTESNEKIQCSFSIDKVHLSENYYKYSFVFNQDDSNNNYDIYSLSLKLDPGYGTSISDVFSSEGGNNYKSVLTAYDTLTLSSTGNYLHAVMLINKEIPEEEINIKLRYSIKGNGLYSKNRFVGIEHDFDI